MWDVISEALGEPGITVKLESVDAKKSKLNKPKVVAKGGKAPAQYDWEDW